MLKYPPATATLLALTTLAASPAVAGDARCLWSHLPADRTANVLTYDLDAVSEVFSAAFSTEEFAAVGKACGVTARTGAVADQALHAYALQLKTEQILASDAHLSPSRLDAAWNGLDATMRTRLSRAVIQETSDPDILDVARGVFLASLGFKGELPARQKLALNYYLICRGIRTIDESRF
jgi:hypothetical protein